MLLMGSRGHENIVSRNVKVEFYVVIGAADGQGARISHLSPSHTWQLFLEIQSNLHISVAKQVAKKVAKKCANFINFYLSNLAKKWA